MGGRFRHLVRSLGLQPQKLALSFNQHAVVPSDFLSKVQPSTKILFLDLVGAGIKDGCIFKLLSFFLEFRLMEVGTTPEHKAPTLFLFAIPYDGVPLNEPDRMPVPYFIFGPRKKLTNQCCQ